MAGHPTGYGPRHRLPIFSGDEDGYELWEVKFLGYMRLQKLHGIITQTSELPNDEATANKNAEAYAELIQCLDDRSLSLVMRDAADDGQGALRILREHYRSKGKPRIIALYTELTSLLKRSGESVTDYMLRAERAATSLKTSGEIISDSLLVAMLLKGLPAEFKQFSTVMTQKEVAPSFSEFKIALRSYEETEKLWSGGGDGSDAILKIKDRKAGGDNHRIGLKCFSCGKTGHKAVDCWSKKKLDKWCDICKNGSHETSKCRKAKNNRQKSEDASKDTAKRVEFQEHSFFFKVGQASQHDIRANGLLVDTGGRPEVE